MQDMVLSSLLKLWITSIGFSRVDFHHYPILRFSTGADKVFSIIIITARRANYMERSSQPKFMA